MSRERIIVASRNRGKLREAGEIFRTFGMEVSGGYEAGMAEVDETGSSYEDNALLKANSVAAVNVIAIGEDSGLEVEALGGRPGLLSARYGGDIDPQLRNELLLGELDGVSDRQARFVAVYAVVLSGQDVRYVRGECRGEIVEKPRGTTGFGYDPVFRPEGCDRTMAELSREEKSAISHRGKGLREVVAVIREHWGCK